MLPDEVPASRQHLLAAAGHILPSLADKTQSSQSSHQEKGIEPSPHGHLSAQK